MLPKSGSNFIFKEEVKDRQQYHAKYPVYVSDFTIILVWKKKQKTLFIVSHFKDASTKRHP